jgi:hypothetical protein
MAYQAYETELFTAQKAAITDKEIRAHFDAAVLKVLENPEVHDGQLKADRAGTFKKKFFNKKWRLTFRYCKFCLKTKKNRCAQCEGGTVPEDALVFIDVFNRRDGY